MLDPDNTETDVYGLSRWGRDYFTVLESGNIGLKNPDVPDSAPVDLVRVIEDLGERGISPPVILRVTSYLEHQVRRLTGAFADAIGECAYTNHYRGVFPIKVNQQAEVVERIAEAGRDLHYGLEIGSKPELVIALSQKMGAESLLICNGIKDAEFLRLALMSLRLGFNTIIVLESPREFDLVLEQSRDLGITPRLGVRIKLTNRVGGKWAESGGDRSSFGMSSEQLIDLVDRLKDADMLDALVLQHSHLGSQIPDILDVRKAVGEACRFFSALRREGAGLTHLDLGGGLGIDYTGEHRSTRNSINYTIEEYCYNIVETVKYAMDEAGEAHPVLVTESGRATVAASSMLLFNILEATHYDTEARPETDPGDHHLITDLSEVTTYITPDRLQECLNDASYYRGELRALFSHGLIDLRQMARGERMYQFVIGRIKDVASAIDGLADDLAVALEDHADIYHGNFSLFQSLPDFWAIEQVHPMAPVQRLHEKPTRNAIISDVTCDSDGRIDRFVLARGISNTLPVHALKEGEDYFLGVFFVGAYQETLGDLHNLFGDTNVVTIELLENGGYNLVHETEGDTIAEVLSYVEYSPQRLTDSFRRIVEAAVSRGELSNSERRKMLAAYKESTGGYTYYEHP